MVHEEEECLQESWLTVSFKHQETQTENTMLKQELRKRSCIQGNKDLHSRPVCRCVELLNVWRTCNTSPAEEKT